MSLTSTRERDAVLVRRQVRVERVPDGTTLELAPGTWAQVTQALGSSFTLVADGQLVRLPGRDADAIGREPPQAPVIPADLAVDDERELVWQTLKTCYDPEIPVDIVELGLIYGITVSGGDVHVVYTLTTPGCPIGPMVEEQIDEFVSELDGVTSVGSEVVFTPPWTPDKMSEDAKFALGY